RVRTPIPSPPRNNSSGSRLLSLAVTRLMRNRRKRSLRQGSWLERGCKSHPSSWAVHDGTRPQQRRREAGLEAEEDEQTGRNESEPNLMSLETPQTEDKPSLSLLGKGRWQQVGKQPASSQRA